MRLFKYVFRFFSLKNKRWRKKYEVAEKARNVAEDKKREAEQRAQVAEEGRNVAEDEKRKAEERVSLFVFTKVFDNHVHRHVVVDKVLVWVSSYLVARQRRRLSVILKSLMLRKT